MHIVAILSWFACFQIGGCLVILDALSIWRSVERPLGNVVES